MLDPVDGFSNDERSIGPVLNDLKALLYQLELTDEEGRGDFRRGGM